VGGHHAHLVRADAERCSRHLIDLASRLELAHRLHGHDLLQQGSNAGVAELLPGRVGRRVRQGSHPKAGPMQSLKVWQHVAVRRQVAHGLPNRVSIGLPEAHPMLLGHHVEAGRSDRDEILVRAGHRQRHRIAQDEAKPLPTHPSVPKGPFEDRIENAQIEQRLIHIKHQRLHHPHVPPYAASTLTRYGRSAASSCA
jgi:hypothetical protein